MGRSSGGDAVAAPHCKQHRTTQMKMANKERACCQFSYWAGGPKRKRLTDTPGLHGASHGDHIVDTNANLDWWVGAGALSGDFEPFGDLRLKPLVIGPTIHRYKRVNARQ